MTTETPDVTQCPTWIRTQIASFSLTRAAAAAAAVHLDDVNDSHAINVDKCSTLFVCPMLNAR